MRTRFDYNTGLRGQRLAELRSEAEDLERKLCDARQSLERELADSSSGWAEPAARPGGRPDWAAADASGDQATDLLSDGYLAPDLPGEYGAAFGAEVSSADGRTDVLVRGGRRSSYHRSGGSRWAKIAAGAVLAALLAAILARILTAGGPSWPPSVATVRSEAARACQNPDVRSEPGQVNFACAKGTSQILWVFALMTSGDHPDFADAKTGRVGLEPITPAQGGEVAWSLNLHHPYSPTSPVDSLAVAARAINNIIGGATLTGSTGNPVVQAGLESSPANCIRYTGSAAMTSRAGFPRLCARPVTSQAGQAALVADVYQKWVVGAPPQAAQNAAVLFENAGNPGSSQVQGILKRLPSLQPPP